jgi:hypothetical protein
MSLLLSSLNAVTKKTATVSRGLGRASPHPGCGSEIELSGGDAGGLLDPLGIGEALSSQGIAAQETPPPLRARLSQHAPVGMKT